MMERVHRLLMCLVFMVLCLSMEAQRFFDLTAEDVRISLPDGDSIAPGPSLLPVFNYEQELGPDYADSVYSVSIEYPEFIDMSAADISMNSG